MKIAVADFTQNSTRKQVKRNILYLKEQDHASNNLESFEISKSDEWQHNSNQLNLIKGAVMIVNTKSDNI